MGIVLSAICWLVFGLIAGAIARLLLPGKQEMSWWATMGVGIVGSFVGGGISYLIWGGGDNYLQPSGWLMSIVGAILVLLIYSFIKNKQQ